MINKFAYLFFCLLVVFFLGNSCKKGCDTPKEDVFSGLIVQDVIIYPTAGYLTGTYGGNLYISSVAGFSAGDSLTFAQFQVSFDGGHSRQYIDFNTYDLLAIPMSINCQASFVRDVSVGPGSTVVYRVEATTCSSCEQIYSVENYVLVPSLAPGTSVVFQQDTKII